MQVTSAQQPPNMRSLWLFGLTILPYSPGTNFVQTTMPFLLSKAGIPVHILATISAISLCPFFLSFLWAPLVDLGWKRRNVIVLSGLCTGSVLFLATLVLPSHTSWPSPHSRFSGLLFALSVRPLLED